MGKVALIAGATGLVGGQLLELLLEDDGYERVIAICRKPLVQQHGKLVSLVCELNQIQDRSSELKADDVYCCLGTTMSKAKSKDAFRAVDFDAPLVLASESKRQGARQFLLVSALGANKNSRIFYNQVKGQVEEAIQKVGFDSYHVFRPSLLLGPRVEQRNGEDAAKLFYSIFGWLIPLKYQAIESMKVARAMISFAKGHSTGNFIHESKEMQSF